MPEPKSGHNDQMQGSAAIPTQTLDTQTLTRRHNTYTHTGSTQKFVEGQFFLVILRAEKKYVHVAQSLSGQWLVSRDDM